MTKGLCNKHYATLRRNDESNPCAGPECTNGATARGLCNSHYYQKYTAKIELRPIYVPGEWGEWTVNAKGYISRRRLLPDGTRELQWQHRHVMEQHLGRELYRHEEVHHLNGNRAQNNLSNLEIWSTKQPKGQRIPDKVQYAKEILALYEPESLR